MPKGAGLLVFVSGAAGEIRRPLGKCLERCAQCKKEGDCRFLGGIWEFLSAGSHRNGREGGMRGVPRQDGRSLPRGDRQAAPGWVASILGRGGMGSRPRPPICAAPTIDPAKAAGARGCGERSALPSAALQRFCDASQCPQKLLFFYLTRAKPGARVVVRADSIGAGSTIDRAELPRARTDARCCPTGKSALFWERGRRRRLEAGAPGRAAQSPAGASRPAASCRCHVAQSESSALSAKHPRPAPSARV